MVIEAPAPLHRYIAAKGSITVDGVSLTVNTVEGRTFGLNIIPHTWEHTTLGGLEVGNSVNLEIDMLARYLADGRRRNDANRPANRHPHQPHRGHH